MKQTFAFLLLSSVAFLCACDEPSSAPAVSRSPAIGDKVLLVGHDGSCLVATSRPALESLGQAIKAQDKTGIHQLALSDQVYTVPSTTRALVIDQHADEYQVRILNGDYAERALWVFEPWIKKSD